jgi:hypothetical protein
VDARAFTHKCARDLQPNTCRPGGDEHAQPGNSDVHVQLLVSFLAPWFVRQRQFLCRLI